MDAWMFVRRLKQPATVFRSIRKMVCSMLAEVVVGEADRFEGACWLKNSGALNASMIDDVATHNAVISPSSQLTNTDTTCQYTNGSTQTTDNGLAMQISCNLEIENESYCPQNSTSCPWHATNLSDCMDLCSKAHPLCTAVSYNPGMRAGYSNCYPKSESSGDLILTKNSTVTFHSAIATISNLTTSCTDGAIVSSSNGEQFTTACEQYRPGSDLTVYHETNITKCMETCVTYTKGDCIGVVFDPDMGLGWENCFLKSATGTPLYNTTAVFAQLSNSTASSGSTGKSSKSKAWIAGPVIGAIVVLVVVGIAALFVARRRRRNSAMENEKLAAASMQGHQGHQEHTEYGHQYPQNDYQKVSSSAYPQGPSPAYMVSPMAEAGGTEISELHDTSGPRKTVFRELSA